ncbi:hypothetical protein ACL03H_07820 [Saccharopolyspora sp. MS10]|uniref:hypothetical protein n=1 Tax=Saccharopolyspora sp. MS10 TaxID=3385973 RepID=UPI0039A33561
MGEPEPRVLADVRALAELDLAGVRWKLAEPGRQLDANVVHLPPHEGVGRHAEPDLDVLLLVLSGGGEVAGGPVAAGALVWLPRGSSRDLVAGAEGLSYLTVHGRRPGMSIGIRSG